MTTALAVPGSTVTFLAHFFGGGLADDCYVVERFKEMVNGDIRSCKDKGRRRVPRINFFVGPSGSRRLWPG